MFARVAPFGSCLGAKKGVLGSDEPLPNGWESRVDSATGRRFYVNHLRRQSSWADPRRVSRAPVKVSESGPVVGLVFEVFHLAFDEPLKSQKDGWKQWEPLFGAR